MKNFIGNVRKGIRISDAFMKAWKRLAVSRNVDVKGAEGSLKSFIVDLLFDLIDTTLLVVTPDDNYAEKIKEDLVAIREKDSVLYFPAREIFLHKKVASNDFTQAYRMDALERLVENNNKIVVTSAKSIARLISSIDVLKKERLVVTKGLTYDFKGIIKELVKMGYVRQLFVDRMGELSVRGGIVDVFPHSRENPIRIEFWGDTVESIREFEVETQRSLKALEKINIYPLEEENEPENGENSSTVVFDYTKKSSLFYLLAKNALVVLVEPELIKKEVDDYQIERERLYHLGESNPDSSEARRSPYFDWADLTEIMRDYRQLRFVIVRSGDAPCVNFQSTAQPEFGGSLKLLKSNIEQLHSEKQDINSDPIHFLCDYRDQANRMKEMFEEVGIPAAKAVIQVCDLHEGFVLRDQGIVLFTDHQFYGRQRRLRVGKKFKKGLSRSQLKMLRIGDFIVHEDYGIGIYRGLKKIKVADNSRECIEIGYKDRDVVYVPIELMMRVQKYSAKEGAAPQVSKLGGKQWERLKSRTKKQIKDIAKDLLAIYAARKAQAGFAYSPDTLWQKELEASFLYEDTPDQVQTTVEIKADMESQRPMDRLVCGDVGFGKTEVAIRAAFKAVNDDKQVAVLVPTTILAQQHYRTFKERLHKFPVEIDVLSRFRSRSEQQQIIEGVNNGKVDIIIGTHRLLSKFLFFKRLGLLVVDEEQRFGVKQKEKIKEQNKIVDVLTLTATPIPRTLNLSLMGARDMSNINTPPKDRLPVITEVVEFDKDLIREAIIREMQRGGQVYFLYNRVKSIEAVTDMIRRLVPEARVGVAHGQMYENALERAMMRFLDRRYDVLVCTTIIENGLDIPNVNTILIHRADRFGLAELYQLRGRVGRTNVRAFAYLMIPPVAKLNPIALKRVRAIEEFTDLGAGFQVALRDLEIRGAGNLLGAEQSGFIAALGFEMYCKILDEAVQELTGKSVQPKKKTLIDPTAIQVEANFDVFIPDTYIERGDMRLDCYRRLVAADNLTDLQNIQEELRDRFGRPPIEILNLYHILAFKIISAELGIIKVVVGNTQSLFKFIPEIYEMKKDNFKEWAGMLVKKANAPFEFIPQDLLLIRLDLKKSKGNRLEFVKNFLQSLL